MVGHLSPERKQKKPSQGQRNMVGAPEIFWVFCLLKSPGAPPPPKACPLLWVPNAAEPFLLASMIHMIFRGLKWLEAGFWFPPRD